MYWSLPPETILDPDDVALLPLVWLGSMAMDSEGTPSTDGVICHIASSSLTTSTMDGLASVSSRQHRSPSAANLSTHSPGHDPIRMSTTDSIIPA
jgi:hypothetical protein